MTRALLPERTELISTIWAGEASVSSNDCKAELLGEGVSVPVENAGPQTVEAMADDGAHPDRPTGGFLRGMGRTCRARGMQSSGIE